MNTTVSSTPCSKNLPDRRAALAALGGYLLGGGMLALPSRALAADVTQLRLLREADQVYLDATVRFELPALVDEVLEKGIAIFFVAEAELFSERWYWTDRQVAQATRHLRLAFQPLTRRWRLNSSPVPFANARLGVSFGQNFETLGDALDAIRRIGRLPLGTVSDLGDAPVHPVVFRFRLDTSQLPRPFQIGVAGNADWNMSAERNARLALEGPQ